MSKWFWSINCNYLELSALFLSFYHLSCQERIPAKMITLNNLELFLCSSFLFLFCWIMPKRAIAEDENINVKKKLNTQKSKHFFCYFHLPSMESICDSQYSSKNGTNFRLNFKHLKTCYRKSKQFSQWSNPNEQTVTEKKTAKKYSRYNRFKYSTNNWKYELRKKLRLIIRRRDKKLFSLAVCACVYLSFSLSLSIAVCVCVYFYFIFKCWIIFKWIE